MPRRASVTDQGPASSTGRDRPRPAATDDGDVFAVPRDAVRHCSPGQITDALFEVGGRHRRSV
jgi:isobutyryl-CoA mutase